MLCKNTYPKNYINSCRKKIELQISTYKNLITVIKKDLADLSKINSAIERFEPNFFNHLVLVLDNYFVHRSRTLELKDTNPLNEVRMLCNSILNNNNIFIHKMTKEDAINFNPDFSANTINYAPEKSVLKYKIGDEINLTEKQFSFLYNEFFAELEKKFG